MFSATKLKNYKPPVNKPELDEKKLNDIFSCPPEVNRTKHCCYYTTNKHVVSIVFCHLHLYVIHNPIESESFCFHDRDSISLVSV